MDSSVGAKKRERHGHDFPDRWQDCKRKQVQQHEYTQHSQNCDENPHLLPPKVAVSLTSPCKSTQSPSDKLVENRSALPALSGMDLYIVEDEPISFASIEHTAKLCNARVSRLFHQGISHFVVPHFDPKRKKLPRDFVELLTTRCPVPKLFPNSPNDAALGTAMALNFLGGMGANSEQLVYVVSPSWIDDCAKTGFRLSEGHYISTTFCMIFLKDVHLSMGNLVNNIKEKVCFEDYQPKEGLNFKNSLDASSSKSSYKSKVLLGDGEKVSITPIQEEDRSLIVDDTTSFIDTERNRSISELAIPEEGEWVETKSNHEDSQIFRAKVLSRWQANKTWYFRLKSPDIGAAYTEPLKNVRMDGIWSTTLLLDLGRGRRSRRSSCKSTGFSEEKTNSESQTMSSNAISPSALLLKLLDENKNETLAGNHEKQNACTQNVLMNGNLNVQRMHAENLPIANVDPQAENMNLCLAFDEKDPPFRMFSLGSLFNLNVDSDLNKLWNRANQTIVSPFSIGINSISSLKSSATVISEKQNSIDCTGIEEPLVRQSVVVPNSTLNKVRRGNRKITAGSTDMAVHSTDGDVTNRKLESTLKQRGELYASLAGRSSDADGISKRSPLVQLTINDIPCNIDPPPYKKGKPHPESVGDTPHCCNFGSCEQKQTNFAKNELLRDENHIGEHLFYNMAFSLPASATYNSLRNCELEGIHLEAMGKESFCASDYDSGGLRNSTVSLKSMNICRGGGLSASPKGGNKTAVNTSMINATSHPVGTP
ncbi:hypothetical protein IE077_001616 [Cardiosporidium cionae]|uniref:BRCT domain-containing protein n=1 Tax=Cardiosporidium cionae TaxID=476202 RepID=A0ABQ7JCP5_9APIC|nr:hypothetical protein IE077_001616 [Cardiosporidium cionae]|eukprot:KAF8821754.1 hypothetical protein IE077_001616 [Cardiosporidium cionae]